MANTDISICRAALLMVGANAISSFSDETREAEVSSELYPIVLESLITAHPWHFSITQAQLSRLAEAPLYGFDYAYQLPPGFLQIRSAEAYGPYEIEENKLYSNEETLKIKYQFRPSEARFPAYFVNILVLELASVFSVSLMEDESKMKLYTGLVDKKLPRAKTIDSQQQPSKSIPEGNFVLLNARR